MKGNTMQCQASFSKSHEPWKHSSYEKELLQTNKYLSVRHGLLNALTILTLTVLVTTIDALQHFETG